MKTFAFFLTVFSESELAKKLIRTVRNHYPDVDFICCDELGVDPGFNSFCLDLNIFYFAGAQIKELSNGGEWCIRMIQSFLSYSDAEYMIRMEPDTRFLRPFRYFPSVDFFGNVRGQGERQYIQGGCFGLSRRACQQLIDSGILSSSLYKNPSFAYFRYQPPYLQPGELHSSKQLVATDLVLWDAVQRLGLSWMEWVDVCCYTFPHELANALKGLSLDQISQQYAALHPCKDA